MTQTKQSIALFGVALLLLMLLPVLLLAQTNRTENNDPTSFDYSADAEEPVSDDGSIPTSDINNPQPGTRPDPSTVRPKDRDVDTIRPFQGNRDTTSTPNPISRPDGQERNLSRERQPNLENRPSLEERKAQMDAKRLEIQANQAERRAALQEKAQERISRLAVLMSNRMEAAIARIEQVITRIESRVEKLKAQGVDTTETEQYLALAKADLTNASIILATIDTKVVTAISAENPRNAWPEVRATYQAARDAIRSSHGNIRKAVDVLKTSVSATLGARNTATNSREETAE